MGRGIFYRSDTRSPAAPDSMFTNGFKKRDNSPKPELRWVADWANTDVKQNAPDIVPESAVCFTKDFMAAPLFPVGDLKTDSWVYVLDLDTQGMTNTQQSQYEYVQSIGRLGVAHALWPMFGQERAVNSVAPGDIVGAVHVKRKFNAQAILDEDVFNGGSFLPDEYRANPGYLGKSAVAVANAMNGFVSKKKWIQMPTMAQGIVKATKR